LPLHWMQSGRVDRFFAHLEVYLGGQKSVAHPCMIKINKLLQRNIE